MVEVLKEVQALSGRAWKDLVDGSKVVGELEGFDSIAGIEATSMVEQRLISAGLASKVSAETIFVDDRRALTLSEVVQRLTTSTKGA